MKKFFFLFVMCFMALTMQAQRCAVLEFKAGAGISQADVDGISAIFITYFRPAGYTMVERTQIDKVIEEQGFQRSKMTQEQMVRVGEILNVSKIVVGDINVVMGQYNVDARVINVETGTISDTEGATFAKGSSYRNYMQNVAQKLAAKIAIKSGGTVLPSQVSSISRSRTSVETLYGYLKIFPHELGTFQSEPTSVISQINKQAQHGYNNWRIPTNEELSLMKANNYCGNGEYMTSENRHGIVLLVTDGKDYATLQAEEQARKRAEQERKAAELKVEQERRAEVERRNASLKSQGLVDLGLPSGTLWKEKNEYNDYDKDDDFDYDRAVSKFGKSLPTKAQWEELMEECKWEMAGEGLKVTGKYGGTIFLPFFTWDCNPPGAYWSSTPYGSDKAYRAYIYGNIQGIMEERRSYRGYVRLIKNP